jgi:hypothetical protein
MMALHTNGGSRIALGLFCIAALAGSGCAGIQARQSQERVAKDWCESIRANQILCTYPMTEDLRPGDVFLVQVPIKDQVQLYREKGFLSLDDHRGRLAVPFDRMYFDGYFEDEFGAVPHAERNAPRAAFPTYTFQATSSGGVSLAIPVQGVPIGLGFLAADEVAGTVTIADASTYATDAQSLYAALKRWAEQDAVRLMLSDTLRQSGNDYLILRVVSRVYLTGGVVVQLTRAGSRGGQAQVGAAQPPSAGEVSAEASESQTAVLEALNNQAQSLGKLMPGSGAVQFASASFSGVTLSETFDKPLVIGYLAWDVPVYAGGVLGAPIPTFESLEGRGQTPITRTDRLSLEQARYKVAEAALEALAGKDSAQALKVAQTTAKTLDAKEFAEASAKLAAAERARLEGQRDWETLAKQALTTYRIAATRYVSTGGAHGINYARYSEAFAYAYDRRDEP